MTVPDFLLAWARLPGPARVLGVARQRLEDGRLGQRATLDVSLSSTERIDVGRLLDASWHRSTDAVPVARLRRALEGHGTDLEDLLVAVSGPLQDLRAERAALRDHRKLDRQEGLDVLRRLGPAGMDDGVLELCLFGAPSRAQRAGEISNVIEHLDARESSNPIQLPVLAAQLFGDSHFLDRNTGLGRAVARFLSARATAPENPWSDPVGDAAAWHRAWELGGVICDSVSSQVLVLNLPLVGEGPAARLTAQSGEPVWLTLRALRQGFRLAEDVAEVFVCENPAIVEAAADRLGGTGRPLVCTFGVPTLATTTLLNGLASCTRLRVRADGDETGWRIVERLLQLPGAERWRMPVGFNQFEEEILDDLLMDLAIDRRDN